MPSRFSSSSSVTKIPTLPRLPVPDLRKTLDKYLTSIEPFLHDTEQSSLDFSAAYQLRKKWADEFYSGIGSVLQERLIGARHNDSAHSIPTHGDGQRWTRSRLITG